MAIHSSDAATQLTITHGNPGTSTGLTLPLPLPLNPNSDPMPIPKPELNPNPNTPVGLGLDPGLDPSRDVQVSIQHHRQHAAEPPFEPQPRRLYLLLLQRCRTHSTSLCHPVTTKTRIPDPNPNPNPIYVPIGHSWSGGTFSKSHHREREFDPRIGHVDILS